MGAPARKGFLGTIAGRENKERTAPQNRRVDAEMKKSKEFMTL
jgi:hypothetical protein